MSASGAGAAYSENNQLPVQRFAMEEKKSFLETLQPFLSLIAHIAADNGGDGSKEKAGAILANVERLAAEMAFRHSREAEFGDAWFAAAAWADETMARFRDVSDPTSASLMLQCKYFDTVNAGEEFYIRLERLLAAAKEDAAVAETIAVYAACLEMGFRGRLYRMEDEAERRDIITRCLGIIYSRGETGEWRGLFLPHSGNTTRKEESGSMTIFWLIPLATTIGLYCAYRWLLAALYAPMP